MKAAIVSHKVFLVDEESGWKEEDDNTILIIQNPNVMKLMVNPFLGQFRDEMKTFDLVVIYAEDSEMGFLAEFAKNHEAVPSKTIFVTCNCNLSTKNAILRIYGFTSSRIIFCGCKNPEIMSRIFEEVLYLGAIQM